MQFIFADWTEADVARFEAKFKRKSIHECWHWKAAIRSAGYGVIGWRDVGTLDAHRVSYGLRHQVDLGPLDEIMHLCHHKTCVNPHHLYLGTHAENMESSGLFYPEQIMQIRQSSKTSRALAREFGCSHTTIVKIRSGKRYSSVKGA